MTNSLVKTQALVTQIFEEAASQLDPEIHEPYTGENNLSALLAKKALEITVERAQTLRSVQIKIVAMVTREKLWLSHPPTEDYPQGYGNLNEMLADTGLGGSTKSYLLSLGDKIIPYCDENEIDIDAFMNNSMRPKLLYAIAALKESIREDDIEGVEMILKDVEAFPTREAIGAKYHTPRARYARGTTITLKDGRVVVLAVVDENDQVEPLVNKMSVLVEWGLPAQAEKDGSVIRADIYDVDNSDLS